MKPCCRVCGRRLKGRIRRWAGKVLCLTCYRHFCKSYRLVRGPQKSTKGGFLSWLFG